MHGERSHSALKSLCFQTEGGLHKVAGKGSVLRYWWSEVDPVQYVPWAFMLAACEPDTLSSATLVSQKAPLLPLGQRDQLWPAVRKH